MYALSIIDVGVALLITALGLRTRAADTLLLFRVPALGLRAVLAMFVFVPACTLLMTWVLPLEPAIRASLLALAVAPMAPIAVGASTRATVSGDYILGLQVFAVVVSLAAVPVMLALAEHIFDFETAYPVGEIFITVLRQIGLPLAVGLGLAALLAGKRRRVGLWLERIGNITLMTGMVLILALVLPEVWVMAVNGRLLSVAGFTAIVVLGGRLLGGPDKATRNNLIMGSAQRHPGVAYLIATTALPGEKELVVVIIVLFVLVSTVATIPYLFKRKQPVVA